MPSAPRSRDEFDGDPAEAARPPVSPTIALVTLSRAVEVRLAALLEPHGLTLRSYGILGHLAATPGLTLADLGRRTHLTGPSVEIALRALTEAGLVRVSPGRGGTPSLTRSGADLVDRLGTAVAALDDEMVASPAWVELAALTPRG